MEEQQVVARAEAALDLMARVETAPPAMATSIRTSTSSTRTFPRVVVEDHPAMAAAAVGHPVVEHPEEAAVDLPAEAVDQALVIKFPQIATKPCGS